MKAYARGKSIFFREVVVEDARFIVDLRTNPEKRKYISPTSNDVNKQRNFISNYLNSKTDFYFVICDWSSVQLGTIRIYDIEDDSFCWGSWIISQSAPKSAAIESALLLYDFAFYSLHYSNSHFDVRKENQRVVAFHKRFGATVTREDEQNYYFRYSRDSYLSVRQRYLKYLP
jgi:RimJ/RimL family protein N-acetyltransferase